MAEERERAIIRRNLSNGSGKPSLDAKTRRGISTIAESVARRLRSVSEKMSVDQQWPRALRALALARGAESGDNEAQAALAAYIDGLVTQEGQWRTPLHDPPQALDGYNLLALHRLAPSARYETALRAMANHFVNESPRQSGCLPYSRDGKLMLVDTLGMLCPFLAGYGRDFQDLEAIALAKTQLLDFIARNLDPVSQLPFHGYIADGPYRLGAHGWGRGMGWYLMGMADTLYELAPSDTNYAELNRAFSHAVDSLKTFQQSSGNWGWVVVMPNTRSDTSVASFCGYALARARLAGFLPADCDSMIAGISTALKASTDDDGTVGNSSGECRGLTEYSSNFGPRLWVQGTAAAFMIEWNRAGSDGSSASKS